MIWLLRRILQMIFCVRCRQSGLLTEPSIPKKQRLALLDEAFGSDMQPYLLNFLKILVENGMVRDFGGCCRRYTALYNADRGIAQAEVTSAVPLSGQQLEAQSWKRSAERKFSCSRRLTLRCSEDFVFHLKANSWTVQ